jgi:hypothetical protein
MNGTLLRLFGLSLFTVAQFGCSAGDSSAVPDAGGADGAITDNRDFDEDGISDTEEGRALSLDTDGDGDEDWRDTDADGDGIADSVEAGDADLMTPARDSDADGTPDFQDTDSDDNGIPDADEINDDVDGDGLAGYIDPDDDNDGIYDSNELRGVFEPPVDTDGDGEPNYRDSDSDNDLILDGHERTVDTDMDGLLDEEDLDSDNDGVPDQVEAGDADLMTPPVDTDMDGTPDFRDTDSDNDGLSDRYESMNGTSVTSEDTDGDGVSDLIELGAGTDATDPMDSPRTRGDFVFVVPFEEAPTPDRDTLKFRTSISFADIYFLFDISGSMSSEINALRDAVGTIAADLQCMDTGIACTSDADCGGGNICNAFTTTCTENPTTTSCIISPWTGTGYYEDYYENRLALQADPAATRAAIRTMTFGGTEELFEAVLGVADPAMVTSPSPMGCAPPAADLVGCAGFRDGAVKILVGFTDEDSDGSTTVTQAADALRAKGLTFIGVWTGTAGSSSRSDLVSLATASDSLDGAGMPLVFDGRDAAVVPAVTAAINEVVEGVPLRVTIEATDEADDSGDALQFIDHLVINTEAEGCADAMGEDTDADGRSDAFTSVLPGTEVCWDVVPAMNTAAAPTEEPQVFRARLTVAGDGSPLDSRLVYFLVPPEIPAAGVD